MSYILNNAFRASRAVAPTVSRRAIRCFSVTRVQRVHDTPLKKSVVREKEVPVTVYAAGQGTGDKHTVNVPEDAARVPQEPPVPTHDTEAVQPLT
ncbi:hypothetical protein FSARC_967, partial [Fusarium sarcochroum]